MQFFRLLDPTFRAVAAVFRIRTTSAGLFVERWDPSISSWTKGPGTLLRFVNEGESGAEEISEQEAGRLIAAGGLPALPDPIPSS